MSFFRLFDNLRGIRAPDDPGRVVEVRPDEYTKCSVLYREDGLCLYEVCRNVPVPHVDYDIVLHKEINRSPNAALSLYRSDDLGQSELQFTMFRDKLPLLLQCVPEMSTRDLVQEIVALCRSNPSWSLAHMAAHLGLVEVLKNPAVKKHINAVAAETLQTPLHVAIKAQKLPAVQTLISLDANVEAVDANHDTMYHCAAITTKDIIKALSAKVAVPPMLINRRNKEGYTPLQLACLMDRADCVKELLKEGADVNSASAVRPGRARELQDLRQDEPPSPKCLGRGKAEQNANNFQEEDMKHGGTPLHWAKSTLVLESMIEYGCDLNARNFQDNTALHIMVARGRLNCVILLLSHGADVNAVGMDGDTPLHVAVRMAAPAADNWLPMFEQIKGDVSVLQALIVFGANVNALNGKGETPRHLAASSRTMKRDLVLYTLHAVGAARCTDDVPGCQDGCSSLGCFDGIAPEKPNFFKSAKLFDSLLGEVIVKEAIENLTTDTVGNLARRGRQCRALALDGGGIRGLVIIRMMMSLEKIVGRPFVQCFDWIAGTSTGGILALCLASGKTTSQCFQMYFRLKDKIFVGARPHDSDALEKLLKQELTEEKRMDDIPYPRIAITAVAAERHPAKLYLFRNYKSPRQVVADSGPAVGDYDADPEPSELIWNVARATGAAPTYFRPYKQYLDGGLIANNPTLDLLTEIAEYNAVQKAIEADHEVADLQVMVSMGTGKVPVVPTSTVDFLQISTGLLGAARMAYGVQKLFQLVVDQATQTSGRIVERAQAWCHGIRVPYFRLNPEMSEDISLNETDNKTLVRMLWEAMVYMRNRHKELSQLALLLQPCRNSPSLQLETDLSSSDFTF